MTKVLIEEFKTQVSEQNLPLILHFAKLHHPVDVQSNESEVLNRSSAVVKRYRTKRYIPGNKFFKPISRTLDE